MEDDLDPQDIQLLHEIAALGEVGRNTLDQQNRLNRLELDGLVSTIRHDPPGLDAPPAWVYRLTPKGSAIVSQTRATHRDLP